MKNIINYVAIIFVLMSNGVAFSRTNNIDYIGKKPEKPITSKRGQYEWSVIIVDKAPLLLSPSSNKIAREGKFGELMITYKKHANDQYFLVGPSRGKNQNEIWGWIEKKNILVDRLALVEDSIYKKIITANNYEEGTFIQDVIFHKGPSEKFDEYDHSTLFKIWWVFAERNGFYLVGEKHDWNPSDWSGKQASINGWVDGKKCYPWKTRFALDYKKDNFNHRERAVFFNFLKELKEYLNEGTSENITMIEKNDKNPLSYYEHRYPVISEEDGEFCYIGIPGEIYISNKDKKNVKLKKVDKKIVKGELQKIINFRLSSHDVDILFVIDNTTSMSSYYYDVINAVKAFIGKIETWLEGRVRIGLTTYRDYKENEKLYREWMDIDEFKKDGYFALNKKLDIAGKDCKDVYDLDSSEAVFNGISESIKNVNWRTNSSRYVIAIGDHGDRPNDKNGWTDQYGMPSKKFFDLLVSKKLDLILIQVLTKNNTAYDNLKKQFKYIENEYEFPAKYIECIKTSSQDDVFKALEFAAQTVEVSINYIDELRSGKKHNDTKQIEIIDPNLNTKKDKNIFQATFSEKRKKLIIEKMKVANINIESLISGELGNSIQICDKNWVSLHDRKGNQQMQYVVLTDKTRLTTIKAILQWIGEKENPGERLPGLITEAIYTTTGDKYDESMELSEYFEKVFGMPTRSEMLMMTETEMKEVCISNPEKCQNLLRTMKNCAVALDSIDGGYEISKVADKNNKNLFSYKVVYTDEEMNVKKRKTYYWKINSGAEFAWVPLEYFP